jgi:hypothetical protein
MLSSKKFICLSFKILRRYSVLTASIEKELLEDLRADGRIILKWIFQRWGGEAWTG